MERCTDGRRLPCLVLAAFTYTRCLCGLPCRDRIFLLTLEEELIKYVQDINR